MGKMEQFNYGHQIGSEFPHRQSALATENYSAIVEALLASDFPESMTFKTFYKSTLNDHILNLMLEILGDEFEFIIRGFIKNTTYVTNNSLLYSEYFIPQNSESGKIPFGEFAIGANQSGLTATQAAFRYTSALLYPMYETNYLEYYGNAHYYLVPNLLMEKIMAQKISLISEDAVLSKLSFLRQEQLQSLHIAMKKLEDTKDPKVVVATHISSTFLLGDVYTNYLLKLYLEEPAHFFKLLRALIKGEINIMDYFKEYGVSLENSKVVDSYLELLKR